MTSAKPPKKIPTVSPSSSTRAKSARPAKVTAPLPAKAVPKSAAQSEVAAQTAAKTKLKLVRDSFTIPKSEYLVLESLKLRAAKLARPTKKGELIRAGIGALDLMGEKAFLAALNAVPTLKTGRPKGDLPEKLAAR
jgi:hypothetical protein